MRLVFFFNVKVQRSRGHLGRGRIQELSGWGQGGGGEG